MPRLNYFDGSSFREPSSIKWYDGSQWVETSLKYHDGSGFVDLYTPSSTTQLSSVWAQGNPGPSSVQVPPLSDWSSPTSIIEEGSSGTWDSNFAGTSPVAVVQDAEGTYYCYYVGSDGTRSDGGPANRRTGLATAPAGADITNPDNWTKHSANPLYDYRPTGDPEEGTVSGAAFIENGEIHIYQSVLTNDGTAGSVYADIRRFSSTDFVNFEDRGEIIAHNEPTWGNDDEIFSQGVIKVDATYYLWFSVLDDSSGGANVGVSTADNKNFDGKTLGKYYADSQLNAMQGGTVPRGTDDGDLLHAIRDGNDTRYLTPTLSDPTNPGSTAEQYNQLPFTAQLLFRDDKNWYIFSRGADGANLTVQKAPL